MDSETDIKTLEQIRHRLISLSGTIRNLQGQFQAQYQPEGLPTWRHISTIQDALKSHLQALQEILRDHDKSAFLKSAHAYPTSDYPWSEENTLALLLRKRLEPDIVTWVNNARSTGANLDAVDPPAADEMAMDMDPEDGTRQLKSADWAELWDWAAPAANQIAREVLLEPEEDEEEEEEEDDDDDEQSEKEGDDTPEKPSKSPDIPMMGLEDILRFASTGATPRGIKQ